MITGEKIFNQKRFHYFFWTPLGSRVSIMINFFLQVHFKLPAALKLVENLPPISLTTVANLPPVSTIPAELVAKFAPVSWRTLTCEYLHEFSKKFETTLMLFSGAWGKMIHEKNLKQKIL
jgi:hypothetical protein